MVFSKRIQLHFRIIWQAISAAGKWKSVDSFIDAQDRLRMMIGIAGYTPDSMKGAVETILALENVTNEELAKIDWGNFWFYANI